jgi:addiction module RelE/StbE family toxin
VKVRFRQRAQRDIENIYNYIESRNSRAATEVAARIRSATDRLGILPFIGHDGRARGTYEWVVVGLPYVIVYEVIRSADEVAIIAIFHCAQNRDEPEV